METSEIKKIVAEQICNMFENNILGENGGESFVGWLEDGDIFLNQGLPEDDIYRTFTEEEVNEIMDFVHGIADLVDNLSWKLAPENED